MGGGGQTYFLRDTGEIKINDTYLLTDRFTGVMITDIVKANKYTL